MGLYGYPLDIQSLFYAGLWAARELLYPNKDNQSLIKEVHSRLTTLINHVRENYWLDTQRLNVIYRYKVEEYGEHALNEFNIYSDSIPFYRLTSLTANQQAVAIGQVVDSIETFSNTL